MDAKEIKIFTAPKHHAIKAVVEVKLHEFIISALN
jgi:hypothetical protein